MLRCPHSLPYLGFAFDEHDRSCRLGPENILPGLARIRHWLISSGVKNPMMVMAMAKNLPVGGRYTFPDGTAIKQNDVVEPRRKGRKLVKRGVMADYHALDCISQGANVLFHKTTNTFLSEVDKDCEIRIETCHSKIHGRSTLVVVRPLCFKGLGLRRTNEHEETSQYEKVIDH